MKKLVLAPCIDQTARWPNGCESVSAVMLLRTAGVSIDPDTFIEQDLPHAPYREQDGKRFGPDPVQVYPGDPHDATGCGCFAPCIVKAMQSALERTGAADWLEAVDETGKTAEELCRYIDAGLPVVFWTTLDFDPAPKGEERWLLDDGREVVWHSGEHCVLLVGYDAENYWFNDPHGKGLCKHPKELVERCHAMQGMAAAALRRR